MRFAHMADIHFDSPFTVLANKTDLASYRRLKQREAFKETIEYIKKEKIPYLFIAGDLYEQEYVRESTIEYINNLFKTIPETKIFISPGNHDPFLYNSYYNKYNWNNNVKIFKGEIERIELEEVDIYGFGFTDFYCTNSKVEEIEIKNKNKINILVIHGSVNASKTLELQYNPLNENKIKKIGFDYIALGHIHKGNYINNENNLVYPGSLISFGFDELGNHGFLDVEINKFKIKNNSEKNKINNLEIKNNSEKNKINNLEIKNNSENNQINKFKIENNSENNQIINLKNNNLENNQINNLKINNISEENENEENCFYNEQEKTKKYENIKENENDKKTTVRFVKVEDEMFIEQKMDVSNFNSQEEIIENLNEIKIEDEKFYKIILEGTKNVEVNLKEICKLTTRKNIIKVKDKTKINYDIDNLYKQKNLKGIFIKKLIEKLENAPDKKEEINRAIEIGLKAFE